MQELALADDAQAMRSEPINYRKQQRHYLLHETHNKKTPHLSTQGNDHTQLFIM